MIDYLKDYTYCNIFFLMICLLNQVIIEPTLDVRFFCEKIIMMKMMMIDDEFEDIIFR